MARMTREVLRCYARALLAALDEQYDAFAVALVELRELNEHRALALEHWAGWLRRVDVGTRDRWLMRQAQTLAPFYPKLALALGRRVGLHDQRAIILHELGDEAGASVAQEQDQECRRLARERRVLGAWDKPPVKHAEPDGRIIGTGRKPRPAAEQEQLDWAA